MEEKTEVKSEPAQSNLVATQRLFTAFLGMSLVFLSQIVAASAVDRTLWWSVFFFALAIPTLTAAYVSADTWVDKKVEAKWFIVFVILFGPAFAWCGLVFVFFHFGWIVGLTFLLVNLITLYHTVKIIIIAVINELSKHPDKVIDWFKEAWEKTKEKREKAAAAVTALPTPATAPNPQTENKSV